MELSATNCATVSPRSHRGPKSGRADLARNQQLPSFSIVVPTYQRRAVVCDAVRALARLDYPGELELIVVVDGSTDGTIEALAELECPFPFRILEQLNSGAAHARNRGAAAAANDIILFLDDDMICEIDLGYD